MGKRHEAPDLETAATAALFEPNNSGVGSTYGDLDVSYARLVKHEQVSWSTLLEGYESLHAITYSSSASFLRDLFGKLREIEVIFGSDVSVKGDTARLFAAQQANADGLREEFGRVGNELLLMLKE